MKPTEALEFTIEKILDLQTQGINVKITKYKKAPYSKTNNEINIPVDKWVCVIFEKLTDEQALKVKELADYLGNCGISFDTGGLENIREWELDWSFKYEKGNFNHVWKKKREEVEYLIKKNNKKNKK